MGFLSGRVTFTRYRVGGGSPLPFGDDILELARRHLIGQHGAAETADGISTGWAGGDHVLDLTLDLGKNVVNDALHLAIRIDADKIPGSLLRAYTQMEIDARARLNPSGFATKAQREEAKEAAKARAAAEAADGRFRRHNHYPVLWDGQTQTLYAGTASGSVLERLQILFRETFDRTLEPITAGSLARSLNPDGSDDHGAAPMILGASPIASASASRREAPSVAWTGDDPTSLDYFGNEFLVWIWHALQNDGETVKLADGSEATVMLAKTLTLDCPRGETGRDQLTDDAPTRLPEALRAAPGGQAAPQGRHGPRPPGAPVRADAPGRDAGRLRRGAAEARRRRLVPSRAANRPHRQPAASLRVARPPLPGLPAPSDRLGLDRRAGPHPEMAPGGLVIGHW